MTAPVCQALTVEQAGELLQRLYVDVVPESVLSQPTVQQMVDALGDPYTTYFTAQEYATFTASMSDTSLVGIGVSYQQEENGLFVNEVFKGCPAEIGGIQPGDIITAVDGQSVIGQTSDVVTNWIRGEVGTTVKITYLREGQETTVTLERATVVLPTVTGELLDGHIGYISCSSFGLETTEHFQECVTELNDDTSVWIVDLRGNTGGYTSAAVGAAACFTGGGNRRPLLFLRDGQGEYSAYGYDVERQNTEPLTIAPVIVLVDEDTASSSEIFASAIRDYNCGIVVGSRTYGKGVAQTIVDELTEPDYFLEGDAMKITAFRFYSPDGNTTDQVGVIPDILVPAEDAAGAAYLLAGEPPLDTSRSLRLDLGWRFYLDTENALTPGNRQAFQSLLNAIPVNQQLWKGTGGVDNWTETSVSEVAEQYGLTYQTPTFPDQDTSNDSVPLSILKTYELVHGKEDGLYHPNDSLTRAELCQMLAEALNCSSPVNSSPFTDVQADAWYAPAVTAMSNFGIIQGSGDGLFHPEDTLDHQQFLTIMGRLARFLNFNFYDLGQDLPEEAAELTELMNYDSWARFSVWLLGYSQSNLLEDSVNLLWDDTANIQPTAATTRGEAASLLYSLLSYINILPA